MNADHWGWPLAAAVGVVALAGAIVGEAYVKRPVPVAVVAPVAPAPCRIEAVEGRVRGETGEFEGVALCVVCPEGVSCEWAINDRLGPDPRKQP